MQTFESYVHAKKLRVVGSVDPSDRSFILWWLAVLSSTVITAAQQNRRKFPTSDAVVTLQLLRGDAANGGRARREVSADSEDGLGLFTSSFSPRGKVEGSKTPSFDDLGPALEAASNGETVFGFEAGGVQYRMKRLARYRTHNTPRPLPPLPPPHTFIFTRTWPPSACLI